MTHFSFINKRELKIFITFFIIYSSFVYWVGWNEQSRFSLTRAIVDEGRLEIDNYANQTSDRSYYNGHYYSDKEPGLSLLAVPVYSTWKFVYGFFPGSFKEEHNGTDASVASEVGKNKIRIFDYIDPGFFILMSMFFVTAFTSSLFSALLVVLVYKISRYLTKKEEYKLILISVAGLGTLTFPYALVFLEQAVTTFLSFLSFYMLFKTKQEKIGSALYCLLAGISSGYAITCNPAAFIVTIGCFLYAYTTQKEKAGFFLFGVAIGIFPLLAYNYLAFKTPFVLPRFYLDSTIWSLGETHGLQMLNPFVVLRLMFYPEKGLFFYYPVLLLSFIGLYHMYKKFKIEAILIAFIFCSFLMVNSSWWAWWGGASFGPRHLTLITPFLALPLIFFIEKYTKKRMNCLFVLLVSYSMLVNFVGLQPTRDEMVDNDRVNLRNEYGQKVDTFEIISNPLYDYYLPRFMKYGPRSRILESIINRRVPDITYINYEQREFFENFYFNAPFLSLLIVLLVIILLWRKQIYLKLISYSRKYPGISNRKTIALLFLIPILIFSARYLLLRPNELALEKGFYPKSENESGIWMKNEGLITLYNPSDSEKRTVFLARLNSYNRDRNIELYLNEELIDKFTASELLDFAYTWHLNLAPGKNTLLFKSLEKCDIPKQLGEYEDRRCLTIQLTDFGMDLNKTAVFSGFYPNPENESGIWMKNEGVITLYNPSDSGKQIRFLTLLSSYHQDRRVELYLNDNLTDKFLVYGEQTLEYEFVLNLKPGENKMTFRSLEKCETSGPTGGYDERCLSIYISNCTSVGLSPKKTT